MSDTQASIAYASAREAGGVGMTIAYTAGRAPDRPAILSERGDRSFAELNAAANQVVCVLREAGLGVGDAVALMCSNRPEFAETFAARAAGRVPRLEICLAVGGPITGFDSYAERLATHSGEDIPDPVRGGVMLYTSGTTGLPKGVHRLPPKTPPPRSATDTAGVYVRGESLVLCTGPLYHAAPLQTNLTLPLLRGVGVVLMDRWDAEETLALIERHGITHTHMVATMFHRMLALPREVRERYDVSSLVHVLHGAAPTPVHVKRALLDWFGPVIYEYYAATEGGGTSITPEEWLAKPGSVGRPNPGRAIAILDDSGEPLPPGQVGTVYFTTPDEGSFQYFKDPEKTASAFRGDLFTLGDHGYVDDDGYLFLTGRTSEVIIAGGVNIYPAEIDAALLMHPAVADVACVGAPNEERGEEVVAVVQLAGGRVASPELADELISFCRGKLARFKCPRRIDFDLDLPRSDAGKVLRRTVRERYWP